MLGEALGLQAMKKPTDTSPIACHYLTGFVVAATGTAVCAIHQSSRHWLEIYHFRSVSICDCSPRLLDCQVW